LFELRLVCPWELLKIFLNGLRKRIVMKEEPTHLYTPLIATQIDNRMMAFVVDEVKEVIEIDKHQLREAHVSPFIEHIVELNNYLLRILDIESTIVDTNDLSIR
jgi:chemotaxis signal transduction protein